MTLSRSKNENTTSNAFEKQFALEVLKSDLLRVTILMGFVASMVLGLLGLFLFASEQFQRTFHGNFKAFLATVIGFAVVVLVSLSMERVAISRLIRTQARPRPLLRYLSAFIETSIPTVGMIVGVMFLGPIYTLFTPAAFTYPIFISLSALRLDFRLCVFTGVVAGVEYATLALVLINNAQTSTLEPILFEAPHHLFKGLLLVMTGVVTGLVTLQIRRRILKSLETVEERNRITRTFGEYVSPVVMNKLLTLKPDLRSEKRNVCVMFLDIRNFTAFAEKRMPEEVVDYLESLFEFMIEIVNRHHGVINKFLGDGFMAVFGAPVSEGSDCLNGVTAAQEILSRVKQEVSEGRVLPTTVGIGLHAGEAVTGSIGTSQRREYTVIGDVVNLASRIEKLNKQFGSQLLISDIVRQSLSEGVADVIPMGQVQVRGRETPIQIYQVA